MAKTTEKPVRGIKQKKSFRTVRYMFVFGHEEADVEATKDIYIKLATLPHADVGSCEHHLKTVHQGYTFSTDEKAREIYDKWGLAKTKEELLRRNNEWFEQL